MVCSSNFEQDKLFRFDIMTWKQTPHQKWESEKSGFDNLNKWLECFFFFLSLDWAGNTLFNSFNSSLMAWNVLSRSERFCKLSGKKPFASASAGWSFSSDIFFLRDKNFGLFSLFSFCSLSLWRPLKQWRDNLSTPFKTSGHQTFWGKEKKKD